MKIKKHLLSVAAVAAFLAIAVASSSSKDKEAKNSDGKSTSATEAGVAGSTASADKPAQSTNWEYSEEVDKMSNEKQYFNSCTSTNKIDFSMPYEGGSSFDLIVRNMGKGNSVLLTVSKGQFMTSFDESEHVRVKFDDEKPMEVSYNSSTDGRADIIFLEDTKKMISKLKTAKKLIIEAPFYQDGRKQIEFDVAGFKWDK